MKSQKNMILLNISFLEFRKALFVSFSLLLAHIIVKVLPLRIYYKKFFLSEKPSNLNMQPFHDEVVLFKKVERKLPFSFSCLIRSLGLHLYLRNFGIKIPIHIGIKNTDRLYAHAWCFHQEQNDYERLKL